MFHKIMTYSGVYLLLAVILTFILLFLMGSCTHAHAEMIRVTAYSPHEADSKPYHGKNALGGSVLDEVEGFHQAAAQTGYLPFGSIVKIDGYGTFIICDTGSGVRRHQVDICQEDLSDVRDFPTGHADMEVLRRGWGSSIYSSKRAYCHISPNKPIGQSLVWSSKRGHYYA